MRMCFEIIQHALGACLGCKLYFFSGQFIKVVVYFSCFASLPLLYLTVVISIRRLQF
jgi:hypothetical protein